MVSRSKSPSKKPVPPPSKKPVPESDTPGCDCASPPLKFLSLDDALYRYVVIHRSKPRDPVLDDLRDETEKLGSISGMLISREQGSFLTLLAALIGARSAVEVGTFTGYSAICIARGLLPEGRLLCIDVNADWTAIAGGYWKRAGLEGKIELRLGGGRAELEALPAECTFDLAFIDADKPNYDLYYELVLPRVRPNGLILFDNMLQHGRILDPQDESARAIDNLNKKLCTDPRVECVLLSIADGLMLCRKM